MSSQQGNTTSDSQETNQQKNFARVNWKTEQTSTAQPSSEKKSSKDNLKQISQLSKNITEDIKKILLIFKEDESLQETATFQVIFGDSLMTKMIDKFKKGQSVAEIEHDDWDVTKDMNHTQRGMYHILKSYELLGELFNSRK